MVIELASTASVSTTVNLWAQTGDGSTTGSGTQQDVYWVTRKFNGQDLDWPSEVAVAMRCLGAGSDVFVLEPNQPVTIIAAILTNHDTPTYLEDARNRSAELTFEAVNSVRAAHLSWWQNFWSQSFVQINDPLIEKIYYGKRT